MVSIIEYWREISIAIGGIASFFVGRKSTKLLEKKQTVDAIDAMQKTYDVFLQHYKEQFDNLTNRLNALEVRNAILTESAESWETKFKVLKKQHDALQLEFNKLKNKI
jgi:chaperonin cofactor prefoldin